MIQVLLIALAVMGAFGGFQTWRVAVCKTDLATMNGKYLLLGQKVAEQNAAVAKWEEAANVRSKAGQVARAKAQAEVSKGAAETERLTALRKAKDAPRDCQASVAEVRKGLLP